MSEVKALGIHYMTFPYSVQGIPLPSWTRLLYRNGQLVTNIDINLTEQPLGSYTFQFANDGTDESTWSLLVYETAGTTGKKFGETWNVRKRIAEKAINQIRSRLDSDGGYIPPSDS